MSTSSYLACMHGSMTAHCMLQSELSWADEYSRHCFLDTSLIQMPDGSLHLCRKCRNHNAAMHSIQLCVQFQHGLPAFSSTLHYEPPHSGTGVRHNIRCMQSVPLSGMELCNSHAKRLPSKSVCMTPMPWVRTMWIFGAERNSRLVGARARGTRSAR